MFYCAKMCIKLFYFEERCEVKGFDNFLYGCFFVIRAFVEFPRQVSDHKFIVSPAVIKALKMR